MKMENSNTIYPFHIEMGEGVIKLADDDENNEFSLESAEHTNNAELRYFILQEDVQSVFFNDDIYI